MSKTDILNNYIQAKSHIRRGKNKFSKNQGWYDNIVTLMSTNLICASR